MRKLILVVTFLLFSSTAHATLIEKDFLSAGDALLTFDTETELEWLDVTHTLNLSFSDVQSELGEGGQFDGWRYATGMEIVDLWTNFGHHRHRHCILRSKLPTSIDTHRLSRMHVRLRFEISGSTT